MLENEYYNEKKLLENARDNLAEFEALNVEEMTEEQIAARNRGIESCKEDINESEEILSEIKEELVEFINNGGEVSEKTKEEIGYFEPITIDFDVYLSTNPNVHYSGYVGINDADAEDTDWHYYRLDGQISYEHQVIVHENEEITGLTKTQYEELEKFSKSSDKYNEEITDIILQSEENENRTYTVGDEIIVKINDGAKFEVEYEDYNSKEWDSDYYMAFTLKYNGEKVFLDKDVYFEDPYTYEGFEVGRDIHFENGAYIVEIPKCWWENPEEIEVKDEILNEYTAAFEIAYAKSLVRDLCVYGTAYSFIKEQFRKEGNRKVFDQAYLQECATIIEDNFEEYDMLKLYFMTDKDVEKIIKEDYEYEKELRKDAQKEYELEQKELEEELKREFGY